MIRHLAIAAILLTAGSVCAQPKGGGRTSSGVMNPHYRPPFTTSSGSGSTTTYKRGYFDYSAAERRDRRAAGNPEQRRWDESIRN